MNLYALPDAAFTALQRNTVLQCNPQSLWGGFWEGIIDHCLEVLVSCEDGHCIGAHLREKAAWGVAQHADTEWCW